MHAGWQGYNRAGGLQPEEEGRCAGELADAIEMAQRMATADALTAAAAVGTALVAVQLAAGDASALAMSGSCAQCFSSGKAHGERAEVQVQRC